MLKRLEAQNFWFTYEQITKAALYPTVTTMSVTNDNKTSWLLGQEDDINLEYLEWILKWILSLGPFVKPIHFLKTSLLGLPDGPKILNCDLFKWPPFLVYKVSISPTYPNIPQSLARSGSFSFCTLTTQKFSYSKRAHSSF